MALFNMVYHAILHDRRNAKRIQRRNMRDASDPFQLPEQRFADLFRLDRASAIMLLNEISPYMKDGVRRTFIPKSIKLVTTLYFYATGSRVIGEEFLCPMSNSMVSRSLYEVTNILQDNFVHKYVNFPVGEQERSKIQQRFYEATGMPGIIGAIDCTHVRVYKRAAADQKKYLNGQGYLSKKLQLICDYDMKILDCSASYGGSAHDEFIWLHSKVYDILSREHKQKNNRNWLVGDEDYPLQPWLLTPYDKPETSQQKIYNTRHAAARRSVERLNGVLKSVFGCLSHERPLRVDQTIADRVLNVCCALHNFRLARNLPMPNAQLVSESDLNPPIPLWMQTYPSQFASNTRERIVRCI